MAVCAAVIASPRSIGSARNTFLAIWQQEAEEVEAQEARRREKAAEHRAKIADSIRRKWEDPEYRARVLAGSARAASLSPPQEQKSAKRPIAVSALSYQGPFISSDKPTAVWQQTMACSVVKGVLRVVGRCADGFELTSRE